MTRLKNLKDADYRKIPCESFSSLSPLLKTPKDYHDAKKKVWKPNRSLDFGTATHHSLQSNTSLVHFKVDEETDKAFKDGTPDGIVIPTSYKEGIDLILDNCKQDRRITRLLEQCEYEVGFTGKLKTLELKGKLDAYHPDFIMDIKTTGSPIDHGSVMETIDKWNYDMQAYLYLQLAKAKHRDYYFIMCMNKAPYSVDIFKASEKTLLSGERKFNKVLDNYTKYILNKEEWLPPILEV